MCVTNCHSCQSKSPSTERNTILCACRDGLPNGTEPLREVAVIKFACCQLFLDFVFVNIRVGLNVSLICGWKPCILLHVLTHGFIIRPCVRVHNNNTLQHETLNHFKQYTFADLNKMLFVITFTILSLAYHFMGAMRDRWGLKSPPCSKWGMTEKV